MDAEKFLGGKYVSGSQMPFGDNDTSMAYLANIGSTESIQVMDNDFYQDSVDHGTIMMSPNFNGNKILANSNSKSSLSTIQGKEVNLQNGSQKSLNRGSATQKNSLSPSDKRFKVYMKSLETLVPYNKIATHNKNIEKYQELQKQSYVEDVVNSTPHHSPLR